MNKTVKIILGSLGGVFVAFLITLCVLLYLGFRFSPESAVHELYRNNTHIHKDEYDFFLHDVNDETGKPSYADGHTAVKRYGFLYKEVDGEDKISNPLVAKNGESVGYLYSYEGESQTYRFIHWSNFPCPDELLPETDGDEDVATAVMYVKYRSETVLYNGEIIELFNYCYFATDEPIETLTIKDNDVYVVNGLVPGDYWNDESVKVINTESDIDEESLKNHYDNCGIIVVRGREFADDVQIIVSGNVVIENNEKDIATVLCKSKSGAPYVGVVQGNTDDTEREIDGMVAKAKSEQ